MRAAVSVVKALRPSSDQTHAECTQKDQNACNHSLLSPEHFPTLVAEEVLRHQFDQRCEDQQAGRDGIHSAYQEQSDFRVRAVQSVRGEADRLPKGCPAHISMCLSL